MERGNISQVFNWSCRMRNAEEESWKTGEASAASYLLSPVRAYYNKYPAKIL